MRQLTSLLLRVSLSSLSESHQGPEVGSEYRPAERGSRVDAHQPADEGVLAALQQGYNVRAHVVGVFLPEVLCLGPRKTYNGIKFYLFIGSPLASAIAVANKILMQ